MDINTKDNLIFSGIFAGIVTGIDMLHKKYGGFLSYRYSDAHSWQEIFEMSPRFFGIFLVFYIGAFIYFNYMRDK